MSSSLSRPLEVASLVDTIVERLESAIMTGELPAGARLAEQALADNLGVSRGPLREALRRLEGRRLIVRVHNVGARVAALSKDDLRQVLIIREALEGIAARLAAEAMSDEDIAALEALVAGQVEHNVKAEGSSSYYQAPDHDFHYRIIQASRNPRLIDMLNGDAFYLLRVYRYRSSALPGRMTQALAEHRAVIAAISARDPDGAENAMRRHLRNSHENMLNHMELLLPTPDDANASAYADRRGRRRAAS